MSSDYKWNKIKKTLNKASIAAKEKLKDFHTEYESSELKTTIDGKAVKAKQFLNESGVTAVAKQATTATSDVFDTVAGTKTLRAVEERLELQSKYNDVLAAKLEEALQRIAKLEEGSKKLDEC